MDAREIEILEYFEPGPAAVKPLCDRLPKSSVYRLLTGLVDHGYVRKNGKRYELLDRGRETLNAHRSDTAPASAESLLERAIPHLRFMPTLVHRAVGVLIVCAIVARRHRLRTNHHPSFVIFGPRLKWKTWTAKA